MRAAREVRAGRLLTSAACASGEPRKGFYLVHISGRLFVSEQLSEPALQRVCAAVLSDAAGWDYWVDYCLGSDINGAWAWANLDQTERFI